MLINYHNKIDILLFIFYKNGTNSQLKCLYKSSGLHTGFNSSHFCCFLLYKTANCKPLDEADPISQSYTLEVSSPGVERELTADAHFEKYIGSNVMVRLIRPINNVRDFAGRLKAYSDGEITLELKDGEELKVNKKETSFVKLDDFDIKDFEKEMN